MLEPICACFVGSEVEGLYLRALTCSRVCLRAYVPASICVLMYACVRVFMRGMTVNLLAHICRHRSIIHYLNAGMSVACDNRLF